MIAFVAQSHGLSTGCLRFVPPSLATTQNSLPGFGQSFPGGIPVYPLSSVGRVLPFGFAFPLGFACRDLSPIFYLLCTFLSRSASASRYSKCRIQLT